jgi:hypothetical protein
MKHKSNSWRVSGIIGCIVVIAAGVYWISRSPQESSNGESHPASVGSEKDEMHVVSREEALRGGQPEGVVNSKTRAAAGSASARAGEPGPESRAIVALLTKLILNPQGITAGEAEEWRQRLQDLVAMGPAAVPAIREFLQKNEDVSFSALQGGGMLGQASLRAGLINALAQIPGPEAQDLMVETLKTTALPLDVALLAQHLEQRAPGQYRQDALKVAGEILGIADRGELSGWDVNSLFQLVQTYGGTDAAVTIEQLGPRLKYYSAISLAGLPNGAGAASLVKQSEENPFALQMLAQMAVQNGDAATALVNQAKQGQVPEGGWGRIATGVAGEQYGMIGIGNDGRPQIPDFPEVKTYRVENGNQNFYSVPFSAIDATPQQVKERLDLVDRLRAATQDPVAQQAFQDARSRLLSLMAKK